MTDQKFLHRLSGKTLGHVIKHLPNNPNIVMHS